MGRKANPKYERNGCQYGRHGCQKEERECAHQRDECEEKQVLTFWLDRNGVRKNTDLRGGFFVFLMNLFKVTYLWLLFAIAMSFMWTVLFNEAGVTFTVDGSAIGILFTFLSLFVVGLVGITDGKRTGGASNWIGLGSAHKNMSAGLQAVLNIRTLLSNPMVEMQTHNGDHYVKVMVPAQSLFKRIAFTKNAIYAAQRNTIRGEIDIKLLPLYADQKAQLMAQRNIDPIESLQSMLNHYIVLLYTAKCLNGSEEWVLKFFKDMVDALGNLDIGGKIPIVESVAQFTNVTLFISTIILPLWFSRIYPGYATVWIAPSLLLFYYALVGFANRQYKIAVTQEENTFSGIAVVKELHEVAATNLARAVAINRQIESARKSIKDQGAILPDAPEETDTEAIVRGGGSSRPRSTPPVGPPPVAVGGGDTRLIVAAQKGAAPIPNIFAK